MSPGDSRARLEMIARRAIEMMDELIATMETAAEQIADGRSPREIAVGKYELYMASQAEGNVAVVCAWDQEDYLDLLDMAASGSGVCLDAMTERDIGLPETEFGENMISGGFGAFKGFSVELKNLPMEDLLDLVNQKLMERGLSMSCVAEEEVVFSLPVKMR